MNRIFSAILTMTSMLLCTSYAAAAERVQPALSVKRDAPASYVVVKGDTLWDISALYLDSPWLWPRLWQINPEIDNPHLIYPGDKLSLVWRNGQPVLSLKPVKKLSPQARVIARQAVTTVAEGLVLPYLQSDRLVHQDTLQNAARVIGSSKERQYLTAQDILYISGQQTSLQWGIYRSVETFSREDVAQNITALRLIAKAELVEESKDYTGLRVTTQLQEIVRNDVALPVLEMENLDVTTTFYPLPAPQGSTARLLGNIEGMQFSSTHQVVVIDRGADDNLQQGSMFNLMQAGGSASLSEKGGLGGLFGAEEPITLPSLKVGELLVIRPYEYFSLGLITQATQPVSKATSLVSPLTVEPNR
ncbi:LysM peptidoglycan-binding domain-containing protein [Vibrio sp. CAU 1672]|uniref:LysM peptidoglycan-binding domain-containing protein n=1 Tax=Vibrio sp. CAU 1672 TaxID=3032594 RepID=UPI0023DAA236|nr:LysM peptidoglycan-binding domain-containing protein [Vibrio sp. CAU 1672]MDF2155105.1 LysM peptidoglycan-binding domain-containing protein [Vibrio sp. CAU 1672]